MQELDGHPLAMRAVLLRLGEQHSAASLLAELKKQFAGAEGDESTRKIFAALRLLDQGLLGEYAPILQLIGLHQRYVNGDYLEVMGKLAAIDVSKNRITACCQILENGGLLHGHGQAIYGMHPALSGFLRAHHPATKGIQRAFVDVMGTIADSLAPKELHEQRIPFALHGANFHQALSLAGQLDMNDDLAKLTQSLAIFAQNSHNFATAEQWYKKSLAIEEKQGNEHGAATTYHQLGIIAQEQRDFATAEQWYKKSLAIEEKQGNEHGAATTYHQLGRIAEEQRDFVSAGVLFIKAATVFLRGNDPHNLAIVVRSYGRTLQAADATEQANLKKAWQMAGLDQLVPIETLSEKLND